MSLLVLVTLSVAKANPPQTGQWQPIPELTDEFDAANLDKTKWHDSNPQWQGRQPALFRPSNVKVQDGKLHLTACVETVPNAPEGYHTFTTAAVKSTTKVLYGYFEIKCKPMKSKATSAFWFYENEPAIWTEIDVFEIGAAAPGEERNHHTNAHVFHAPEVKKHLTHGAIWKAPYDLASDYHVYALAWNKDEIKWFVDGQLVRTLKNQYWHQPLTLNFDSETMPDWFGLPAKEELPATFSIEYVRSWKRTDQINAEATHAAHTRRIPASTANLLVAAQTSGNLDTFQKGVRGTPNTIIFDPVKNAFAAPSEWHEYGVGFGQDLGIVPEDKAAYWMAQWPQPIEANLIALSGVYPNQPQPDTAWKIEWRHNGVWTTHARGVGDWYNSGSYFWGGAGTASLRFDALRVSVWSKDEKTPLKSIHFRGEAEKSWLVAKVPPFAARIVASPKTLRAGQEIELGAETVTGEIRSWQWRFEDGTEATGQKVRRKFDKIGPQPIALTVSDGKETSTIRETLPIQSAVQVDMEPFKAAIMAGQATAFTAKAIAGVPTRWTWDFGDGTTGQGQQVAHTFNKPGIYQVRVTASDGRYQDSCLALVRAHTEATRHLPQVLLDTDAKNEQDDQHYLGYALFSELDVLAVNSIHHGGGQEPVNYAEIQHVYQLARDSGLPAPRVPTIFRGANQRLAVPDSGKWNDTEPIITEASEAILAAARGASPDNPIWIVPVGPGTNMASALLQAAREGVSLKDRIRIIWLGGSNDSITHEFNGDNDPWSMFVVAQSGIETWILPAPVGARVAIDKRTEGDLYADHPLGRYLKEIVPAQNKALFDPACLSVIISERLGLGWVKETESVTIAGPESNYKWTKTAAPSPVRVIRQIDQKAMQLDIFQSMKGKPTPLIGVKQLTNR